MPIVQVFTNVSKSKLPAGFRKSVSDTWRDLVGKPEKLICASVYPDTDMSFGGTEAPAALVKIKSIGSIDKEKNVVYSKKITELLATAGVAKDRMFICFEDLAPENVGHMGTTFAAM